MPVIFVGVYILASNEVRVFHAVQNQIVGTAFFSHDRDNRSNVLIPDLKHIMD